MALNFRLARSTTLRLTSRYYSSAPYPFTKPDQKPNEPAKAQERASGKSTPYPFTQPTSPRPVASPTGPVKEPGPLKDDSALVSREASEVGIDESLPHEPDYGLAEDYRTSPWSPIPTSIQDGSEPGDRTAAAVISGAPIDLQARTVRIFKPTKTATQSGDWHSSTWRMDWDVLGKGHRWENPLMGWQSSADYMQATHMNFKSKEDAIRFAEKQGYEYHVQEPNERRRIPKAYATQFEHSYGKLKTVRTK